MKLHYCAIKHFDASHDGAILIEQKLTLIDLYGVIKKSCASKL